MSRLRRRYDLGILLLGTGRAAEMHARTLKRSFAGMRLYAAGRSASRAAELIRSVDGTFPFPSPEDALGYPGVDVVVIATPPASHLPLTLDALRAGKHVIVEKPAFLAATDFDTVERAANRHGRRVFVAENYFYKPLRERLRTLVRSGELGQIRFVQINAVKRQSVEGWRDDPSLSGGGALFEGGIHWIDFMAHLGLDIVDIAARLPGSLPGFERSVTVSIEYAQGAVGTLSYSWEIPGTLRGLRLSRIWGTRASVLFETNGLFVLRTGARPKLWMPGLADIAGYRAMFADFLDAVVAERPARFGLRDARRDVELVERAYSSVIEGANSPRPDGAAA